MSHEFALNGNPQNPYCQGIPGVVAAYHQAIQSVDLWGPTNMAPVINHVKRFAEAAMRQNQQVRTFHASLTVLLLHVLRFLLLFCICVQSYFVLLVLTDGDITDMEQTKRAIIESSSLPMSIIIVGVGGASFEKMVELDADDNK